MVYYLGNIKILQALTAKFAYIICRLKTYLFWVEEEADMETRVAVISIIVAKEEAVERLNAILHDYAKYIIGRMGLPYRAKGVNIICVAVDAPNDAISALSGKLGSLDGVSVKTAYSNVFSSEG